MESAVEISDHIEKINSPITSIGKVTGVVIISEICYISKFNSHRKLIADSYTIRGS